MRQTDLMVCILIPVGFQFVTDKDISVITVRSYNRYSEAFYNKDNINLILTN